MTARRRRSSIDPVAPPQPILDSDLLAAFVARFLAELDAIAGDDSDTNDTPVSAALRRTLLELGPTGVTRANVARALIARWRRAGVVSPSCSTDSEARGMRSVRWAGIRQPGSIKAAVYRVFRETPDQWARRARRAGPPAFEVPAPELDALRDRVAEIRAVVAWSTGVTRSIDERIRARGAAAAGEAVMPPGPVVRPELRSVAGAEVSAADLASILSRIDRDCDELSHRADALSRRPTLTFSALWPYMFKSIALTISAVSHVLAMSFLRVDSENVAASIKIIPIVLKVTLGFLIAAVGLVLVAKARWHRGRTWFPRRIRYVLPVLGFAVTAVTAWLLANRVGDPAIRVVGIVFSVPLGLAFAARLIEADTTIAGLRDPSSERNRFERWIVHHHGTAAWLVFGGTLAYMVGRAEDRDVSAIAASAAAMSVALGIRIWVHAAIGGRGASSVGAPGASSS